jgi:urease accessory protein
VTGYGPSAGWEASLDWCLSMPETLRAVSYLPPGHGRPTFDLAVLMHDERRVRRRAIELVHGDTVLVDFPAPVTLESGSGLLLSDGRIADIVAGEELLYEVRGRDPKHLMQLCWHIGNRHAKAQIENEWEGLGDRILILRDHVLRDMLIGLGAIVTEISEPFHPQEGAYTHAHGNEPHALIYKR